MNRRIWTGVVAGVLAAAVLLTVGAGAYRAGQRDDDAVSRVVTEDSSGEVIRVVNDGHGFRPGSFLFPLLVILLITFLVLGRGWGRGWHRHYGHGHDPEGGPGGPGYGHGHGFGPGSRYGWFEEWHRRAHEAEAAETARTAGAQGPQDEPPPGTASPSAEGT